MSASAIEVMVTRAQNSLMQLDSLVQLQLSSRLPLCNVARFATKDEATGSYNACISRARAAEELHELL